VGHWHGHFPDWLDGDGHRQYGHWGSHFPEDPEPGVVYPVPPTGVQLGALVLEVGLSVTWSWSTAIEKSYDATEKRAALVEDPAMRVEGAVLMAGDLMRLSRARLARYAARGEPFLFGLPWEALAIRAKSTGAEVAVWTTARADWALPGMRVLVSHRHYGAKYGTIQSVAAQSITLDTSLGTIGSLGAQIMPILPLFLDAQQAFARYPDGDTEHWQVKARNASAGFSGQAIAAELALEAPLTNSGVLDGARLVAVTPGADGNDWEISQSDDALTSGGEFTEDAEAKTLHIQYSGNETTLEEYALLLQGSSWRLVGTWDDEHVLASSDDEFSATSPSGGSDATPAVIGLGVTIDTYRSRPVWERGLDVESAVTDSIQSMADPQDLGGLPFVIATSEIADGGRMINVSGPLGIAFQYVKKFLWDARAAQASFWLSTARKDLEPTAVGTGTLTVAEADLGAWFPDQREHLEIVTSTGTVVRARIASRAGNVLSLVDESDVAITLGAVPRLVSWLELCRFEQSDVAVRFTPQGFETGIQARSGHE
jgi:hypothetical protein